MACQVAHVHARELLFTTFECRRGGRRGRRDGRAGWTIRGGVARTSTWVLTAQDWFPASRGRISPLWSLWSNEAPAQLASTYVYLPANVPALSTSTSKRPCFLSDHLKCRPDRVVVFFDVDLNRLDRGTLVLHTIECFFDRSFRFLQRPAAHQDLVGLRRPPAQ